MEFDYNAQKKITSAASIVFIFVLFVTTCRESVEKIVNNRRVIGIEHSCVFSL